MHPINFNVLLASSKENFIKVHKHCQFFYNKEYEKRKKNKKKKKSDEALKHL